ncbi:MAG: Fe-S cluster assembly protein SufD [Thermoplasmatota archaeon]
MIGKDERYLHAPKAILSVDVLPGTVPDAPDLGLPQIHLLDGQLQDTNQHVREWTAADGTDEDPDHFAAINRDEATNGVVITVPKNTQAAYHLVNTTTKRVVTRVHIHLETGAELRLIEHHLGHGTVNQVTRITQDANSHLKHDKLQEDTGIRVDTLSCDIHRDANCKLGNISLNGDAIRNTATANLLGAGAHAAMHGLYVVGRKRHVDNWTRVDHAVADCTSEQLYKGVLSDEGHGAFTGNILVRKDAQRTRSEQENRNLLLSRKAHVDTTPQLEIHADDVQCAHGSTVGQLDEEALFFLRTRGIGAEEARVMLTKAFVQEVVDQCQPEVRELITSRIEAWFMRHEAP